MGNEHSKNHEIFQRFFAENFERVKGYLIHGIFDHREYFWQEFQDFLTNNDASRVPLNRIGTICEFWSYDSTFRDYEGVEVKCKPGIVFRESDSTGCENLKITVRNSEGTIKNLPLSYVSDFTKKSTNITYKKYNFKIEGVEGEGFVIVGPAERKCGKLKREVYCSDIFTEFTENNLPISDESVFDAFFGFFSAVRYATKHEEYKAAYFNLEQTLKLIIGEPVSPLRYLVAFADQYEKYLSNFYGLSKDIPKDAKLDDRITSLNNKISECRGLGQLLYLRKFLRNETSHEDKHIVKYRENVRHFILDFICITYLIQHKVNNGSCNPVWNDSDRLEAVKIFFSHVATHNVKINVGKDGFSEPGACYVKPFKKYMASVESNGNTVSNEIEIGKDLLENTNLELTLANDKIAIGSNKRLEVINSFDYGPLVDSLITSDREMANAIDRLNGMVDSLPSKSDVKKLESDVKKLKKNLDAKIKEILRKDDVGEKTKNALLEIKKSLAKDNASNMAYIKELEGTSKKTLTLVLILISVVAVLLTGLMLSNVKSIAISNEFFYTLSQSIGIKTLTYNFPYERALYLENQIWENQEKDLQSGNRAEHRLINPQMIRKDNALRAKAAECYQTAIGIYKSKVDDNPDKNADLAARLAQMYSLGKGGQCLFEESLKYAEIAADADMEKYTGMYIYYQFSQGGKTEIRKTLANRLDYLSETDPFYPLIKAKSDIADALSLPLAQKDSVIRQSISCVDSVVTSSSIAAPFAVEQLAVWYLDGCKDSSDRYIIDKDTFLGINYLTKGALKFNLINSQTILADILCNFTFVKESSELYAAAFYNGDINSGYLAHDVATRLLRKSEEEIKDQWPRLYYVKKSRNSIEKIRQIERNLTDGNYEYSLINLEGLKDNLPDNIGLIGVEDAIRRCKILIPDSVKDLKEKFSVLPINSSLIFRQNSDSLKKREAIADYVDAYIVAQQNANETQALIDSLLNESWTKGFVDAGVLLADRIYKKDQYHSRAEDAFKIMKEASSYSDEANLWLADKYYITEISESRKYLDRVKDGHNFYKLIRQYDELELDHYNNAHPYTEKELSLMRDILNSFDIKCSGISPHDLAAYLIYCAAISGNDKFGQSAISFYLSSAHGINRSSCAIFYPLYIQEHLQPYSKHEIMKMYNVFAEDFALPKQLGLSPVNINYLQLRIRETSRGNEFYTDLDPYPSFLSRDVHPETIVFKAPESLYNDK